MNETLQRFERKAPAGSLLPQLITPAQPGQDLLAALPPLRRDIDEALLTTGGVLLRGFGVPDVETFQRFASAFGHPLLKYEFASTPRSAVISCAPRPSWISRLKRARSCARALARSLSRSSV